MPAHDATIEEYALELEITLDLVCADCKARFNVSDDIRKEEEHEAPWGSWARRQAVASKKEGWFVLSPSSDASVPGCLCPVCAHRRGLVVHLRDEEKA